MPLRCFLFSPDGGTSDVIRQVLTGLGVEGDSCSEAEAAGEKIANEAFHLVIIDWDQPEAATLLTTARERKASERPLILAIVSDDASVPKALQAGANSILRRPILINQVKDTLTTAHDLLRARVESANAAALAAAAAASPAPPSIRPANMDSGSEKPLRTGDFLQARPATPGGQFETETDSASLPEQPDSGSQLKELEPVATSVPTAPPPPPPEEPRTLEELLRSRGVGRQSGPPQPPTTAGGKPDLLGFDQTPSFSSHQSGGTAAAAAPARLSEIEYAPAESEETARGASPSRFRLSKGTLIFASVLACLAVALAPQAPWHPKVRPLWSYGQRALHGWLNPQPVTTPTAPPAHEDFTRAGDEYKLPVAENIPDATTDPSQIHVVPVVDPTAKKPASADQPPVVDGPNVAPGTSAPPTATQVPDSQPAQSTLPPTTQPAVIPNPTATVPAITVAPVTSNQQPSAVAPAVTYTPVAPTPEPPKRQPAPYVPPPAPKVPSSLQSQMATMVPDASGNKPPEAAMPTIEPVTVPELTERALLDSQPPLDYPAAAGAQQGTVVLQVLIGRDGAVQDAKFVQGSLVFARSAIASVKQWKFKPYTMNGRPVSVQTTLSIKFKPGQ